VTRASTLLNLAQCEQHEGRLASASKHWKQGIDLLPPNDERLAISKERAAELEKRVPHFTVKLTGQAPPDARAQVDGADAKLDDLLKGVPADPGKHTIALLIPGRPDQRASVELAEGDAKTVGLTIPDAGDTPPPPVTGGNGKRTAGFVIGGIG